MFAKPVLRAHVAAVASGLAFALASTAVLSQPGPGGGFGHGAGHRGHHGGDPLARIIEQHKGELALNTSQQQMLDAAVAATRQARQSGLALRQPLHDAMRAELAKPEPDLAAVAAMADEAQAKAQTQRRQVRAEWLKLYETFTPQQKAIVRDALLARMQRHDQMREHFKQRAGVQG